MHRGQCSQDKLSETALSVHEFFIVTMHHCVISRKSLDSCGGTNMFLIN